MEEILYKELFSRFVVVLGTAHELYTPGKGSPDKSFREPIYSREIVSGIDSILKSKGITTFIDYLPIEPLKAWRSKDWRVEQNRELSYRVNFVNNLCKKYGKKNVIYVSIHNDAAGSGGKWMTAGGWSIFTTRGTTPSDELATCIYKASTVYLKEYATMMEEGKKVGKYDRKQKPFRLDYTDGDPDKEANYFVLKNTVCPAVLSENLFQDNREDVKFLTSTKGKQAIINLHVDGIINYLKSIA